MRAALAEFKDDDEVGVFLELGERGRIEADGVAFSEGAFAVKSEGLAEACRDAWLYQTAREILERDAGISERDLAHASRVVDPVSFLSRARKRGGA